MPNDPDWAYCGKTTGFVFTNETSSPLPVNSFTSQYEKLSPAAAVPRMRFYDSRHTSVALLLAQDIDPTFMQERTGHANIGKTLNRYSHVTPSMQREAAEALDMAIQEADATGEAIFGKNKLSDTV